MQMFEAVQEARKAVRTIDVSGKISVEDLERIHSFVQQLAHAVHPDGCGTNNGHAARVVLKNQICKIIEEEIRLMRYKK